MAGILANDDKAPCLSFGRTLLACTATLLLIPVISLAQDNERQIVGEVSTSDYRAPFGDDLEIFNLGEQVNSEYSEYNPVISPDASLMLFTTRNDTVTGQRVYDEDRKHFEDIHIARERNGRYMADSDVDHPLKTFVTSVNSRKHEAPVYIQESASRILLFKENDLWYSDLKDGQYNEPQRYPKNINFKYYHRHASLTKDGKTMVFTSEVLDKKLNRFHLDIFKTTLNENGEWTKPERLPTFINSPYNEDSPEISPDGRLLFFSSDRVDGMGGYDVYYVELFRNDSIVHRLDAPINSPADDIYFKMVADSSVAFISSNRLGGYGNMDIYKILFHRFDTETCESSAGKSSKLAINGMDTVLAGGRLIMNSSGSSIGGMDPRTVHWYLEDSLVSVSSRLDIPMTEAGDYEVRLYASVIDKEHLKFYSACSSRVVHVLSKEEYSRNSEAAEVLTGIAPPITELQLLNALPLPTGDLALQNDVVTTYVNNPVMIEVTKNDGNDDVGELKFVAVGRPLHGTAVLEDPGKGKVLYHPTADYVGLDAFKYTMRNPYGRKGSAWVGIRVLDNALFSLHKKIKDDEVETPANTAVKIDLFANDTLPDGLAVSIKSTTDPVNGALKDLDPKAGTLVYHPKKDFIGSDMFTYTVDYPNEGEQKAFVRIHVLGPQGRMPIRTRPDFASTQEGELVSLNVLLNDNFNDADAPRIAAISKTSNGASQIYDAEEGTLVFAPFKAFTGYEYFTYTVELKDGSRHVEAVNIYVEPADEILAAVDESTGEATAQPSSTAEIYNITEIDEDRVDISVRPDLPLEPIYFGFDKVNIRQDAQSTMAKNLDVLKQHPKTVIQVVSHCDSRGSKAYNMILSARRAKSTVDYLVRNGIAKARIVASVGVGEDGLVNDCGDGVPCTIEEHQMNRRSEFIVVGTLRE